MLVHRVVVADELVEAAVQVGAEPRRIVPAQRRISQLEAMVVVVREAGKLLWSRRQAQSRAMPSYISMAISDMGMVRLGTDR